MNIAGCGHPVISRDIPAMAIVDRLDMATGGGSWQWRVFVRTPAFWHRQVQKVYFIEAPSDTLAAQEGIRRFVEESKQQEASPLSSLTVH